MTDFIAATTATFARCDMGALLDGEKTEKLHALFCRLVCENEKYNLTAVTDRDGVILKHFADSAAAARYLPTGASLLDVGCGAGFPSLPLAILRPDLRITALDATAKRVAYVAESASLLGLSNVQTVTARAEEYAKPPVRESFDCVTARAVSNLRVLAELCLPFVRVGGLFLSMKAKSAAEELSDATHAIGQLGGRVERTERFTLSDGREVLDRTAILIRKTKPTEPAYPRAYARILKKPL